MTGPTSLLLSRRDLDFLLHEWLGVATLTQAARYRDHSRETFDAVLETYERIATDLFATHYQKSDREEPVFDGLTARVIPEVAVALKAVAESGLFAATQDYALGGMQLPYVIEKAGMAYLLAANFGTAAYPFLSIGNANLLLAHGNPAQIKTFVEPTLRGQFFGTMCLSEPQAGSSLADIATRADYECESPLGPQYRLTGSKMWISGGEHELSENIVHLVLARTCTPDGKPIPGIKGLSLFIVPKFLVNENGSLGERNDVALAGLNHKMGCRGTTNCLLNFGEGTRHRPGGRAGAVGYRVGKVQQGMAIMFHMMNEARIGVGLGASALGYTGYLHALDYARNRPQGRSGKDPSAPQQRIIEHPDVRRMLLAQKAYAEGALALNLYCARLIDEKIAASDEHARDELNLLLEILTPIAKSWPAQWCVAANDLAIQVHGGYGYTREYKVEQIYRDNRLNPIHEGTHGIHGLDLLGRKVVMHEGAALQLLCQRIRKSIDRAITANTGRLVQQAEQLNRRLQRMKKVTHTLLAAPDSSVRLANASLYLEAFGHVVIAWIWLDQALAAERKAGDFYDGKRAATRYFFNWELPKVDAQFDLLASLDATSLEMVEAWY
jgi:alkylation response protein AidB-like acyl-CoA dehydrogenase